MVEAKITITREINGEVVVITLTPEEMRRAYLALDRQYTYEDITDRCECREIPCPDELCRQIYNQYQDIVDCELSYWDNIDNAIDSVLREVE